MVACIDAQPGIRNWIAVFVAQPDKTPFYWWQVITGRKWAHVWLFGLTDCGYLIINARGNHMYVEHFMSDLPPHEFLSAATMGQEIMGVVDVEKAKTLPITNTFYIMYSCVSVVKDVLGIRKWWIVTPRQLYNHLTTCGEDLDFTVWKGNKHHGRPKD